MFEHTAEYPDAGVQVPAGGLEASETSADAATREVWEETGLNALAPPVYLGSRPFVRAVPGRDARDLRHYFWLRAPDTTPDTWTHVVSAGERDRGLTFLFRFAPLHASGLDWNFDELIDTLRPHLETP